jgi:hypothetical protein
VQYILTVVSPLYARNGFRLEWLFLSLWNYEYVGSWLVLGWREAGLVLMMMVGVLRGRGRVGQGPRGP